VAACAFWFLGGVDKMLLLRFMINVLFVLKSIFFYSFRIKFYFKKIYFLRLLDKFLLLDRVLDEHELSESKFLSSIRVEEVVGATCVRMSCLAASSFMLSICLYLSALIDLVLLKLSFTDSV
jgi:hypothetical protein